MPLEIVTIPCLSDNYAYLVNGPDGVALIDAPEAGPIIAALEERGWSLGRYHDHAPPPRSRRCCGRVEREIRLHGHGP